MAQILTETTGSINEIGGVKLNQTNTEVNPNGFYFVDWNKMSNVQDLITILAAVGFNFSPSHPHFDTIKPLLDLENPVIPNQQ
jgi:hypothetical protein